MSAVAQGRIGFSFLGSGQYSCQGFFRCMIFRRPRDRRFGSRRLIEFWLLVVQKGSKVDGGFIIWLFIR